MWTSGSLRKTSINSIAVQLIQQLHILPFSKDSMPSTQEWTGDDWTYRARAGVGNVGTLRDDFVAKAAKAKSKAQPWQQPTISSFLIYT